MKMEEITLVHLSAHHHGSLSQFLDLGPLHKYPFNNKKSSL